MSDEMDGSSGFSPFLWYKLGQSSARASEDMGELAALVQRGFAPPQVVVDRDRAIAEVYRLDNELRVANESIQRLNDHSAKVEALLAARNGEIAELRARNGALQRDIDIAVKAYHDSATEYDELVKRVVAHSRKENP
jgi:hypothetical protein